MQLEQLKPQLRGCRISICPDAESTFWWFFYRHRFWNEAGRTSEIRAAVVSDQLEVQLGRLHCLSVNPQRVVFNERQYPVEGVIGVIGAQLAIPRMHKCRCR
jgi:hypothetical protein